MISQINRLAGRGRALGLIVGLFLVSITAPTTAYAANSSPTCAATNDVVAPFTGVPVVYVHGWTSSASGSANVVQTLRDSLEDSSRFDYAVKAFDYGPTSTAWPAGGTAQCLASYLARVWEASGKRHKIVVVAHSMGGLATRFASSIRSDVLAGVVTLATPHRGSPWGNTAEANILEAIAKRSLPPSSTSGQVCLADLARRTNPPCAPPPYLPDGVSLDQIGTQITVKRTLFNIGPFKKEAEISLYGDGIVPADSAAGYPGSVLNERAPRLPISITSVPCKYSTDYLLAYKAGARLGGAGPSAIIGGELAVLGNIWVDGKAADDIAAGRTSPALAQLTAYAAFTDCFHTNMTTKREVVAAAVEAIERIGTREIERTALPPAIAGEWTQANGGQTHAMFIEPNGSATVTVTCVYDAGVVDAVNPNCALFEANMTLTSSGDDSATATFNSVEYPEDTIEDASLIRPGDQASFTVDADNVLQLSLLGRLSSRNGIDREGGYPGLASYCRADGRPLSGCSAG